MTDRQWEREKEWASSPEWMPIAGFAAALTLLPLQTRENAWWTVPGLIVVMLGCIVQLGCIRAAKRAVAKGRPGQCADCGFKKEIPMLVGEKVFHVPTNKVVTVRNPNTGNGFVGVHWHAKADDGTVAEHTAGYHWQQIRNATAEELHAEEARMAELFPEKAASDPSVPAGSDTSAADPGDVSPGDRRDESLPDAPPPAESDAPPSAETHHKRKRQ